MIKRSRLRIIFTALILIIVASVAGASAQGGPEPKGVAPFVPRGIAGPVGPAGPSVSSSSVAGGGSIGAFAIVGTVIYTQDTPVAEVISSGVFPDSGITFYAADDVDVPVTSIDWTITHVAFRVFQTGTPTYTNMTFAIYADAGGVPNTTNPAAALYHVSGVPYLIDLPNSVLELTLPGAGVTLPPGKYWFSVFPTNNYNAGDQLWFYLSSTNNGYNPAFFTNVAVPPCVTNDWSDGIVCLDYATGSDMAFTLYGAINDPAVIVTPTTGNTDENGASFTFDVYLEDPPTAPVTIDVASTDVTEATVDMAALNFDAGNYSNPQTVTVTGVDDFIVDGAQPVTITLTMNTTAPEYAVIDPTDVTLTNADNDAVFASNLVVIPTDLPIAEENPGVDTFTVRLGVMPAPGETVTVDITYDPSQITLSTTSFTFDDSNWNIPVTVEVDAIMDGIDEPIMSFPVDVALTSTLGGASVFFGLNETVNVTVFDRLDEIIPHIPNIGLVTVSVLNPQPLYEMPNGNPLRRESDLVHIWIPQDYDGNGFDTHTVTDYQIDADGTVWLQIWLGSANFPWVRWYPNQMPLEGEVLNYVR